MATELFEATASISTEPQMIGEELCFYTESNRLVLNASGDKETQTLFCFVRYTGRDKEDKLASMQVEVQNEQGQLVKTAIGTRVAFSGEIIGNEDGKPFIVKDPETGELFTRFDVRTFSLRVQGRLAADSPEPEDLVTLMIVGFLGKKIDLRYSKNGTPVANTSIACNHREKQPNGTYKESKPVWWKVAAWGKTAEGMSKNNSDGNPMLDKGSAVWIKGTPTFDKNTGGPEMYDWDGAKAASYEMTVFAWGFSGRKSDNASDGGHIPEQVQDPDVNDL